VMEVIRISLAELVTGQGFGVKIFQSECVEANLRVFVSCAP
jgi:hypothetical protein